MERHHKQINTKSDDPVFINLYITCLKITAMWCILTPSSCRAPVNFIYPSRHTARKSLIHRCSVIKLYFRLVCAEYR